MSSHPFVVVHALGVALVLSVPWAVVGQPVDTPRIVNGRVDVRAGVTDIAAVIRALPAGTSDVTWVGWSVPVEGKANRCCWHEWSGGSSCCGACRLERDGASTSTQASPAPAGASAPIPLEPGADRLVVLARVVGGAAERIRTFSSTCTLDAAGRQVVWLPAVRPDASVAWLETRLAAAGRRQTDDVLAALAGHAAPQALDRLLAHARAGATTHLRGQALFWLAQRAGERAVGAIAEAVDRDPDTEVKRKAVFALSQLPDGEGVPRLIDVARDHSNPAVRKQAFFWLGQSKDPRALAFFADVLRR